VAGTVGHAGNQATHRGGEGHRCMAQARTDDAHELETQATIEAAEHQTEEMLSIMLKS